MHNIHCRYVSYVNYCYFMGFWHAYVQLRISIHIVIFLLLSQFPHFLQFGHMLQALQADCYSFTGHWPAQTASGIRPLPPLQLPNSPLNAQHATSNKKAWK